MIEQNNSERNATRAKNNPAISNAERDSISEVSDDADSKSGDDKIGSLVSEPRHENETSEVRDEDIEDGGVLCF